MGDVLGKFAGLEIPLLFVIFMASLFTSKNAHIGLLFLGITISVMVLFGFLSVDPLMWGLIILLIMLGLLLGRKV